MFVANFPCLNSMKKFFTYPFSVCLLTGILIEASKVHNDFDHQIAHSKFALSRIYQDN